MKTKVVDMSHVGSRFKGIVVTTEEYENYLYTTFDDNDDRENYLFSMCENGVYFDETLHEYDEMYL